MKTEALLFIFFIRFFYRFFAVQALKPSYCEMAARHVLVMAYKQSVDGCAAKSAYHGDSLYRRFL